MQPEEKVIIFCGKKARADDLSSEISMKGISCQCIHGGREQVRQGGYAKIGQADNFVPFGLAPTLKPFD